MVRSIATARSRPSPLVIEEHVISVRTRKRFEFVDLTEAVQACLGRDGVRVGLVNVQVRHTTAAIVTNENEPLLIRDLEDLLRKWAPRNARYRHNLFDRRKNPSPGERPNGHAHARALVLRTSETLNVRDGKLDLGRWQRIFLVELDGRRERSVSVVVLGRGAASPRAGELRQFERGAS